MLNHWHGIGRLTRDVDTRHTQSGKQVASFTLAVDREGKDAQGNKVTDFVDVVAWGKLAELCEQYLSKGRLAYVEGPFLSRTYENREGQKVKVWEVNAQRVKFLDRGEKSESKPSTQSPASRYEDDPFADDTQFDLSDDSLPF